MSFSGRWENFSLQDAFALGRCILNESKFSVFIAVVGHPLTTLENAHELNPHLCGNSSFSEVDIRYIFSVPIGLGDVLLDGTYDYNLSSNQKKLFFLKLRSPVEDHGIKDMFVHPSRFDLIHYTPTPPKNSTPSFGDQFLLASAVKGEKNFFESLVQAGINVST